MDGSTNHTSRRAALGLIGAALVWPRPGRADTLETMSGTAFGTTWGITAPYGSGLERIRPNIEALFHTVDRQMSPWRRDSVISRFNAGSAGWHAAGKDLIHVTRAALTLAEDSGGAFDPTVGPLVSRWGFGPIEGGEDPNWRGLSVGAHGIAKTRDDLTLDLCGIAKGRALDRATDLARSAGFENVLFDLGGELSALGQHPSGRSWRVAVEHPGSDGTGLAVLRLPAGQAVATSGLGTQSYSLGMQTYGHIIDPVARRPVASRLRSVTVLAGDAMTADGWATTLFAAGESAGPALAQARGLSALFVVGDGRAPQMITTGTIEDVLI